MGAAPAEFEHPAVQRQAQLRFYTECRPGLEQRLEPGAYSPRLGQRQNVARHEESAVGVRTGAADTRAIDHGHIVPVAMQVMRAGDADVACADNQHTATGH